jgi:DNA polymerase elongation subunit (family B)
MEYVFKLTEFNVYNDKYIDEEDDNIGPKKDSSKFIIQMFGLNEKGHRASIIVEDYPPFFYLKVPNHWGQTKKKAFLNHLKTKVGKYYENCILDCKIIERKKLYGYDAKKKHRFIEIKFANVNVYNKIKNLWYADETNEDGENERRLLKNGYIFDNCYIELYEANIPPLLRFFHIREVSPSGWIAMPIRQTTLITGINKTTSCDFEFSINYKHIIPLNNKEDRVPYKIMSIDIEASSSHGDFPVPVKSYKKLATNIVDHFAKIEEATVIQCKTILVNILRAAFGFITMDNIDLVYPKEPVTDESDLLTRTEKWFKTKVRDIKNDTSEEHLIELLFENANKSIHGKEEKDKDIDTEKDNSEEDATDDEDTDDENAIEATWKTKTTMIKSYQNAESTIVDIMCDKKFEREGKINELIRTLRNHFPALEGDKVTFIGSTFMTYGDSEPYLNHCIALNSCNDMGISNGQIETYNTEKEVLLAWTKLVQTENPDIIIGYNIFSFDYEFMFRRSQELQCVEEFLKLSRNNGEICAAIDCKNPDKIDIDRSSTSLASGSFDLAIIKMNGRLQIDMLNWFRRTENFTSYKLDYVSSHIIGDEAKSLMHICKDGFEFTRIMTTNMTGLQVDSYIHFEEINHSSDYYKNGQKFKVTHICKEEGWFEILGTENPYAKKVKWGLAKDDVTPKDIFRMTNEGPKSRAIIAKYCVQDCNLVHYLFNKVDVLTDLIEMSKLCSVPMSFLIYRGQGIKLTSYVAKKCREKGVLMPVINKGSMNEGYEGAIVLDPKCALYLDDAVPVGDFAALYPSSILSENLCPSSKVWTKIYDLAGNLIAETGDKNDEGYYIYDNLPGIEYINVRFDTYIYIRKTPKSKAEKIKSGYKECRFAQPTIIDGVEDKAIMPSILQELLKARKDTRKLIPQTQDEFIKNVLEKRQLAYKLTANSLYGQLGAKTSTFYEPDIAAATTATGRLLLTFAKRVVEECYADTNLDTKYGLVNTKAEYVYGDSVANYTPIYISTFKKDEDHNRIIDIVTIEDLAHKYGNNNWVKCSEPGKQDKEFCELENVDTWTEKGWTNLRRVIRHALAPHKKMMRVLTHTGCVDVTDDHSLVKNDGLEISPKDVTCGTELLHCSLPYKSQQNEHDVTFTGHFNNMIECAIYVNYLNNKNIQFRLNSGDDLSIVVVPNPLEFRNPIAIKKLHEISYSGYVYDLTTDNHHFAAGVGNMIVHNTDSVFFKFNLTDKATGEKIVGEKALELSIEIAQEACSQVSKVLKQPHDFEYEKTFMPFCLLSKKRYVGIKYEFDPTKGKRSEMGIVLKRRDNAPIVKDVYGGVIDILMKEKNIQKAIEYVHKCLRDLVDGNISMDKLIITKSLRSFYKKPESIAHKVLADRIGQREPGNKPTSGDRIEFVYIVTEAASKSKSKAKKILQGDKIETPTFIIDHNLKIDYSFYITNQIMKPLLQLFGLVLKDIWMSQKPPRRAKVTKLQEAIDKIRLDIEDEAKCEKKISKLKNKEVEELMFSTYLRDTNNAKNKNQSLTKFFAPKVPK